MQLGIYTFGDNTADPETGKALDPAVRMANLLEEIALADELGLDVFGLGEHHRPEYLVSAPAIVLAAAAARTRRIRLSTAVTVLSSEDPIRVFQQFATLDLVSGGRAEIMAGRGSFIESFPLFGYDLEDYDGLFEEKLAMLIEIRKGDTLTWPGGQHTPAIPGLGIYPRPVQDPLPLWIAVGGTPNSVARAGYLGLPLALAIIGGYPEQFGPLVDLYRRAATQGGHDPARLPVSVNSHGFIAETAEEASAIAYPAFSAAMAKIGKERGWAPQSRAQFDAGNQLRGATFVGSPQQVIDKILYQHEIFGHDRFLMQMAVGHIPHDKLMKSIELFGTVVAPAVRKALPGPGK